jgi:hypothetical protein
MWRTYFPWLDRIIRRDYLQNLALRAEANARKLSGLSAAPAESRHDDLSAILESTCLLLDRLVDRGQGPRAEAEGKAMAAAPSARDKPDPSDDQESTAVAVPEPASQPEVVPNAVAPPAEAEQMRSASAGQPFSEQVPSATATELVKLRDWVLLAKTGGRAAPPAVLDNLYREMGKILHQEGLTPLEETGAFDYKRQKVAGTEATDDPGQDGQVCNTVRPGYLFQNRLFRPQEVILYKLDTPTSVSPQ